MRAGRLIALLRLLQARGRMTAPQLAAELEVSTRTILRDIDALSEAGVPVYAVRGARGGFDLLEGIDRQPLLSHSPPSAPPPTGRVLGIRVRMSPHGRRLAALLGRPGGVKIRRRPAPGPDRDGWVEASVRVESVESALHEVLALGAEIEVLSPPELRRLVADTARRAAALYD